MLFRKREWSINIQKKSKSMMERNNETKRQQMRKCIMPHPEFSFNIRYHTGIIYVMKHAILFLNLIILKIISLLMPKKKGFRAWRDDWGLKRWFNFKTQFKIEFLLPGIGSQKMLRIISSIGIVFWQNKIKGSLCDRL